MPPFAPRETRFVELKTINGWRFKTYSILSQGATTNPAVLNAVEAVIRKIELPADKGNGFIIVHFGTEAIWLLIDCWVNDILHHFLFRASLEDPAHFTEVQNGTLACVWELAVIEHERSAWIRHVMSNSPDFHSYESDTLAIVCN